MKNNKLGVLLLIAPLCFAQAPPPPFDLTLRTTLPISQTRDSLLADMNGDGRPDLITQTADGLTIRLNDGTGTFLDNATVYPLKSNLLFSFVVGDFNHDGFADIAAVTFNGILVFNGNGKGGLGPFQRMSEPINTFNLSAVSADFNGDGLPDIAIGVLPALGYVRVFMGTASGAFEELKDAFSGALPDPSIPVLQVVDFNGDGKPDLLVTDTLPRTLTIVLNDGTGKFKLTQIIQGGQFDRPRAATFGFFDKDGAPGLVVDYQSVFPVQDNLELWKADTTGQFTPRSIFKTDAKPQSALVTADVDGDGNQDVIGSTSAGITVYFGDGSGGFARTATVASVTGTVFAADLDGDGKAEIVVVDQQSVSVLGGTFRPSRVLLTRDAPNPFTSGQVEFLTASVLSSTLVPGFPTGTITLFDGTQLIAVSTLSNGTARFSTRFVPGIHAFHTTYSGDNQYPAGTADLILTEAGAPAAIRTTGTGSLQVIVADALGDLVPGAGVVFTAPIYGPSGTFSGSNTALAITGPDGIATAPLFTQNNYPGPYSITAVVSGYPSVNIAIPVTR